MPDFISFLADITWEGVLTVLTIFGITATVTGGAIAITKHWMSNPSAKVVNDVQELYKELSTLRGVVTECRAELDKFSGINDSEVDSLRVQIEDAKKNIERVKNQIERLTSVIIDHFGKSGS